MRRRPWFTRNRRVALFGAGLPLLLLLLAACARPTATPVLADVGYLLAGANTSEVFARQRLALFDARAAATDPDAPLTPTLTRDLPRARIRHLAHAPDGTLWLGLSGDFNRDDDRVLVYAADGTLLKTLHPCTNPDAGINFAAGHAFIACAENGFAGSLVMVDMASYQTVARLPLALENAPALLTGSAADEQTVLITTMTTGPDPQRSYAHLFVVDAATLTLRASLPLGPDTDVWTVLPGAGRFYLLNVASARATDTPRPDVFLFDPQTQSLEAHTLPMASPLWGALRGNRLYTYHHPGWNTTQPQTWRALSAVDVSTWQGESWPLPDAFDAGALAIWDERPCLTYASPWAVETEHGLYCLSEDGTLKLRVAFPGASGVWLP